MSAVKAAILRPQAGVEVGEYPGIALVGCAFQAASAEATAPPITTEKPFMGIWRAVGERRSVGLLPRASARLGDGEIVDYLRQTGHGPGSILGGAAVAPIVDLAGEGDPALFDLDVVGLDRGEGAPLRDVLGATGDLCVVVLYV